MFDCVSDLAGHPTAMRLRHASVMEYVAQQLTRWTTHQLSLSSTAASSFSRCLLYELETKVSVSASAKPAPIASGDELKSKPLSGVDRLDWSALALSDSALKVLDVIGAVPDRMSNVFARNTPPQFKPQYDSFEAFSSHLLPLFVCSLSHVD
jgi:hypothetical protein